MKQMKYLLTLLFVSIGAVQSAWADDVVANVTLKEKNSLSTEILAIQGIDDVKTVTHLTVTTQTGVQLGDEDWTTLQSMSALVVLDLQNASANAVPDGQFSGKSNLVTVVLPNTITSIGEGAFGGCDNLENCDLSACNITEIPDDCFDGCEKLNSFNIPASVTDIGYRAFYGCESFTSPLPTGLKSIGSEAFMGADMLDVDVVIPEGVEVERNIFYASNIRSITFPTTYYRSVDCYDYCTNLQKVTMKSPTLVDHSVYSVFRGAANVTLEVPSHLVAAYKSHPEWSLYKDAIAISPAVTDYTVSTDLNLSNSSMRLAGTPSMFFTEDASLTIAGSTAQAFNDFTGSAWFTLYWYEDHWKYTQIYNEEANVTVSGDFKQRIYSYDGQWYFMSLPFDFTVGDVIAESGSFVIRTYDGARRNTENTNTGNWSANLASDVVITAGTGFILQTSDATWITFKAKADGTNYAFKKNTDEPQIALAANNANGDATTANTGWNMVGNPWQTFYNIHNLNYTAPFAVYDYKGEKYVTYSPSDDDYALRPFQALFVQCPSGITTMDFPATGRQLTSEVTSQNAAPKLRAAANRKLLDIQIAGNGQDDKTRLVVNPGATIDYEIGRDASKFFANGTATPQIYSLGADGTQYAINEQPADNGTLKLGIVFATDGEYTISAIRNDIGQVILKDNETGMMTDLQQHGYTFDADAGISNSRFTLSFGNTTAISTMANSPAAEKEVYTLDGSKIGNSTIGLKKGVYVVRNGQRNQKVIVK